MEWSKVKNIIILILLMLNAFLLVLVLGRQRAADQYARSAVTRAVQVLEQNGVKVSEDALGDASAPPELTVSRDLQAEQAIARALLGEDVRRADRSGGLYVYEGAGGSALFRASGEFEAELTPRSPEGRSPAAHAAALLKQLGLEGELVGAPQAGESGEVVMLQKLNGVPVYSCRLVFRYDGQGLTALRGTLLAGQARSAPEQTQLLDLPNTLIRFLDGVLEQGSLCSAVTGLRPGYRLTQSFGAELHLAPAWLVSTDAGSYYLDGATGALEAAGLS